MKKLLLSLLFAVVLFSSLLAVSLSAGAYYHYAPVDSENDCFISYNADFENGTAEVYDFDEYSGKVIIPSTVRAYDDGVYTNLTVTSINFELYDYYTTIDYFAIPESVTEITPFSVGYRYEYNDEYWTYEPHKIDNFTIACVAGSYAETYAKENGFTIKYLKSINSLPASLSNTTFTYSFYYIEPEVTITDGAKKLVAGTDFTVEYDENRYIGEASVIVHGIGDYLGNRILNFKIVPIDVSMLTFSEPDDCLYDGYTEFYEPYISVSYDGKGVHKGSDYDVIYKNNDKPGTATATFVFKDYYTGTKTITFNIVKVDATMLTYSEIDKHKYTGEAIEPYITIKYDDTRLWEGDDYDITYENNIRPGTATMVINFKGYISGTKRIDFEIYVPKVENLTATTDSSSEIRLSWDSDWSVNSYYVYRYSSKKKKYVKIAETSSSYYYDAKLKSSTLYKYKVYAVIKPENKKAGVSSASSVECSTLMKAPKTELTLYKNSVKIKYSKVNGADGYTIYRQRADKFYGEEEIKKIKKGKAGSYTDKTINPNGIYAYYVIAYKLVDGKRVYGELGNDVSSTADPDVILRGAKLNPKTYFTVYDTQGTKTTSYTYHLSQNDINILKNFQKKHFKKNWTDAEKLWYTLYWINGEVLYARGENWNKISGKSWVDAIFTYKMGQCAQYNGAMAAMLVYMGYDASIIKGYRGTSTQHFWCEVKIQGRTYVMETGNYGSSGGWSYFLAPYGYGYGGAAGYVKNKASATTPLMGPDVETVELSKTKYTYNGKAKKPSVKVINTDGKVLQKDKDYTLKYSSGRKKIGSYEVTVTFKGKYAGKTTLTFHIVPATPKITELTAGKTTITVSASKVKGVDRYWVECSTDKDFTPEKTCGFSVYDSESVDNFVIKNLKKNKKYYVRVKAIQSFAYDGYQSDWSKVKSIKTKK